MNVGLSYEFVEAGMAALEKRRFIAARATLASITKHRVALSLLTTPVGEGFSSIIVELRGFHLYANVRPAISFPNTKARYSDIDIITVRENTEGAYIGEGQNTSADGNTATLQQRVTRKGSERIVRYALTCRARSAARKSRSCTRPTSSSRPRACS